MSILLYFFGAYYREIKKEQILVFVVCGRNNYAFLRVISLKFGSIQFRKMNLPFENLLKILSKDKCLIYYDIYDKIKYSNKSFSF